MGLLDELRAQAERVREKEQFESAALMGNIEVIDAKLKEVHKYLEDFVNSLSIIQPNIYRYYYLDDNVIFDNLPQGHYRVSCQRKSLNHNDYLEEVRLRMKCASDEVIHFTKKTPTVIERMRHHLWMFNLRFECKETRNDRGYLEQASFTIPSEVPISFLFSANFEQCRIHIMIKNLEQLGEWHFHFAPDAITHEFLDEIAKSVLAKPHTLKEFGLSPMPDSTDTAKGASEKKSERTDPPLEESKKELTTKKLIDSKNADVKKPTERTQSKKKLFTAIRSIFS